MTKQTKRWQPTLVQQELFARLVVWLGSPWEAARRVGVPAHQMEETVHTLLTYKYVKQKMRRHQQELEESVNNFALGGILRLATYSGAGGLRVAMSGQPLSPAEAEQLDLFGVSALKWSEKGCEVKFFDRMPALALLCNWQKNKPPASSDDFLNALRESAAKLGGAEEAESEPQDV